MTMPHTFSHAQLAAYLDSIQALLDTGHYDQAELLFGKFQEEFAAHLGEPLESLFDTTYQLFGIYKGQRRFIQQWHLALVEATAEEKALEERFLKYWEQLMAVARKNFEAAEEIKIEDDLVFGSQERSASSPAALAQNLPKRLPHWRRLLQLLMSRAEQEGEIAANPLISGPARTPEPAKSTSTGPNNSPSEQGELAVYALGSFRVFVNGMLIEKWWGNKGRSLLKYFVSYRDRPIHRDVLMDIFWGADEPEAARRNLHQAIYSLRRSLQYDESLPPIILYEDNMYFINPQIDVWSDFESFLELYYRAQQLDKQGQQQLANEAYEAAANLYSGDFMGEDIYEAWPFMLRENLKLAYLDLLDQISQYYLSLKNFSLAILYSRRILQEDNCREDIHRRLMRAYMTQGQRHLALNQYYRCEEALAEELNVEPMPATSLLLQEIQQNPLNFSSSKN